MTMYADGRQGVKAGLMTSRSCPDRDSQFGIFEGQPVVEGDSGTLVYNCDLESEDGCRIRVPRDWLATPRTYVTEISVPRLGDDGVQRLYAPMKEPEPEAGS